MLLIRATSLATGRGDNSPLQLCGRIRQDIVRRICRERCTEGTDEIENSAATGIRFRGDSAVIENCLKTFSCHNEFLWVAQKDGMRPIARSYQFGERSRLEESAGRKYIHPARKGWPAGALRGGNRGAKPATPAAGSDDGNETGPMYRPTAGRATGRRRGEPRPDDRRSRSSM